MGKLDQLLNHVTRSNGLGICADLFMNACGNLIPLFRHSINDSQPLECKDVLGKISTL